MDLNIFDGFQSIAVLIDAETFHLWLAGVSPSCLLSLFDSFNPFKKRIIELIYSHEYFYFHSFALQQCYSKCGPLATPMSLMECHIDGPCPGLLNQNLWETEV